MVAARKRAQAPAAAFAAACLVAIATAGVFGAAAASVLTNTGLGGSVLVPKPPPLPAIAPLSSIDSSLLGNFVDLSKRGGPSIGIGSQLFGGLQDDLLGIFPALTGPSLPNAVWTNVAMKWSKTLVKFQYSQGIQNFLDMFGGAGDRFQDKVTKAVCTIYPWTKNLPSPVKVLKDSYCINAVPANILEGLGDILPGGGPKLPKLP